MNSVGFTRFRRQPEQDLTEMRFDEIHQLLNPAFIQFDLAGMIEERFPIQSRNGLQLPKLLHGLFDFRLVIPLPGIFGRLNRCSGEVCLGIAEDGRSCDDRVARSRVNRVGDLMRGATDGTDALAVDRRSEVL